MVALPPPSHPRATWVNVLLALLSPFGLTFTSVVLAIGMTLFMFATLLWWPQVQAWHTGLLGALLAVGWHLARPRLPAFLTRTDNLPWPKALAVAAALLLLFSGFTKTVATIGGFSGFAMQPTLHDGERISVRFAPFLRAELKRGTIVEFREPRSGTVVLSRVVAVGGETVELRRGVVYVNATPVDDPARLTALREAGCLNETLPLNNAIDMNGTLIRTVPAGHLFMVMDNRNGMVIDSRFYGPVPESAVLGTVRGRQSPRAVRPEACRATAP